MNGGISFYRCDAVHDEIRWAWPAGQYCWMCGAVGRPAVAMTITAIDAFIRDLDADLAPPPVAPANTIS